MHRCAKCGGSYEGEVHACVSASERAIETMVTREDYDRVSKPTSRTPRPTAEVIDARIPRSMAYMPSSVIGSYRVEELLGDGAIGRVYLAEHIKLGKKVALKMLRQEYAENAVVVKRFFAEARSVSKLAHENIVSITDFFEDQDGKSYYIMERLEGRTLRKAVLEDGLLALPRVLGIAKQIAGALQAAHDQLIVHRDLKPENVFLISRGDNPDFVKLLDFGVAKLLDGRDARLDADTVVGTLLGSPPYMAPEQTMGTQIDHRADIYAFGVLLYELLTGANPFATPTIEETIERHRNLRAPLLPHSPHIDPRAHEVLMPLLARCLHKDPRQRPATMAEIAGELAKIDLRPLAMRRAAIAVAVSVVVLAGVAYAVAQNQIEEEPVVIATVPIAPPKIEEPVIVEAVKNEPAPPQPIRVEIDSDPRGAVIRRGDTVLGATPFALEVEPSNEAIELVVEKTGYESTSQLVTPDQNVGLMIQLRPKKKKTPAREREPREQLKGKIDPTEQKNPFGQ